MGVGSKIKQKRNEKGFSQELLSEKLHISQATLSNIEAGKSVPDVILLQQIADSLDMPLFELLENQSVIINNNQQGGNSGSAYTVNQLSEKVIEQYKLRLKEKDEQIKQLRRRLDVLEKR